MLAIIFLFGLGLCYYIWQRERSTTNLFYIWFCVVVLLEIAWQGAATTIMHLSGLAALWDVYFNRAFWIVASITLLASFIIEWSRKKK